MRTWLKHIREKQGFTQEQVSKLANINRSYYTHIENGNRGHKLPAETAMRIAAVLGFEWTLFYEKNAG